MREMLIRTLIVASLAFAVDAAFRASMGMEAAPSSIE